VRLLLEGEMAREIHAEKALSSSVQVSSLLEGKKV
jgi:hypothetical protein